MRFISFLLILVQAAPAQESDAEKLFMRMEERMSGSKSLQFAFKATIKAKESEAAEGTLFLGESRKLYIQLTLSRGEKQEKIALISDGKSMAEVRGGGKKGAAGEPPAELNAAMKIGLARAGAAFLYRFSRIKSADEAVKSMPVSDFKQAGREKVGDIKAEIVEYSVEIPKLGKASVRVWIDPVKLAPLKQTVTATVAGETATATTVYENLVFDEPIDDAKFKLP